VSKSTVSYLWREPHAAREFTTGVSLHSHTCQSRETLDFIAELSTDFKWMQPIIQWGERRSVRCSGIKPDYLRAYWTPPLNPKMAFELERDQIENLLQVRGFVSITDHDDISAPLLLRNLAEARHAPVSVEWSVPYANESALPGCKPTAFHLGIHNLPSASSSDWIARLNAFTEAPIADRPAGLLGDLLAELAAIPSVLIVFNHPLWDLYRIGADPHGVLVNDFLARHGQYIHALELNGLRHWTENDAVKTLAAQWNQIVISGGDRHGIEPNANVNLTHATSFTEFVHEVRDERISNVLFMPQYKQPWKHRILQSTLDAIRNYPHFPEGSRRWDERVFAPNMQGEVRKLSDLWNGGESNGRTPVYLSFVVAAVRLMGRAPVSGGLRLAWNDASQMRASLARQEAEKPKQRGRPGYREPASYRRIALHRA
jgi:hypothetical protein